jgi:hypothetical protein
MSPIDLALTSEEPTVRRRPRSVSGGRAIRVVIAAVLVGAWTIVAPVVAPVVAGPVAAKADPTIAAAGDIACDPLDTAYDGGAGNATRCRQADTARLLTSGNFAAVLALGDNQYECGASAAYEQVYNATWGKVKSITHPVPGNHEFLTSGGGSTATGCNSSNINGAGYYGYFGAAAGTPGQGYYSFNVGTWHLIALNSNCSQAGGCSASSAQGKWLAADLASHTNQCTLAYWHIPLFSSGGRANNGTRPFWNLLYAAHADIVLDGHDHIYERFSPQTPTGASNPNGIRQFTVGTGGANHTAIAAVAANSVVRNTNTFGILALTLHPTGYNWSFKPAAGSFTDSGSGSCH